MITIVNCGLNNLRSVEKAFAHLGHETRVSRDPQDVLSASKIVMPGVGAFGAAMGALNENGLDEAVLQGIMDGKPFLGVCLALQLLFDWSEELGLHTGLGVVSGKVVRLEESPGLKIPHMGWSKLSFPHPSKLFAGVAEGEMVYFVHSYHAVPDEPEIVAARSTHGVPFTAAIERENVMAVQFHPEKSSAVGLKILDNFARL